MPFGRKPAPAPLKPLNLALQVDVAPHTAPRAAPDMPQSAGPIVRHFTNDYIFSGTGAVRTKKSDDRVYQFMVGLTLVIVLGAAVVMVWPELLGGVAF
jgi:hypothetical protein